MIALLAGLVAGSVHVITGPDHLAAIAPLAADADRRAWRAGLAWGLGHTAGVLVVGLVLLAFREVLPMDALSAWSERLVGAALIGLGGWGLWHARTASGHGHVHAAPSFGMGVLHGLAGSSHLYGVLPSLMLSTRPEAAAYLAGFGVGAVGAMMAFAAVVGRLVPMGPSRRAMRMTLLVATSAAAVVVGGAWLLG